MIKYEIQVAGSPGRKTVKGHSVAPYFGAHRANGVGIFAVTHLPTGLSIAHIEKLRDAQSFAREITNMPIAWGRVLAVSDIPLRYQHKIAELRESR